MSHARSHAVTDGVTDAGRTLGVTLLQTRPDQTRLVLAVVCGLSMAEENHHRLGRNRPTPLPSDDDSRYAAQTKSGAR